MHQKRERLVILQVTNKAKIWKIYFQGREVFGDEVQTLTSWKKRRKEKKRREERKEIYLFALLN